MKNYLLLVIFAAATLTVAAQSETSSTLKTPGRTSFYAELGGPGILFSANVDTRFKKSHLGWGGRAGIGFVNYYKNKYVSTPGGGYYTDGDQVSVVTLPLQVNHIFGRSNSPHAFEVGAGITIASKKMDVFNYNPREETSVFGTVSFMYRRQPKDGGFAWRIGFTPLVAKGYIQPSGAVGVGYNF